MIKKSVENELISGMQRELRAQSGARNVDSLGKAVDYLQSAMEILEEAGMQSNANTILGILSKVAEDPIVRKKNPVKEMPSMHALMEAGLTQRDLANFSKGDPVAKAKVNQILRNLGRTDKEIIGFLGKHNFMSEEDAESMLDPNSNLGKMWDWMQNPTTPMDQSNPRPEEGEETELMREFQKGESPSFTAQQPEMIEMSPVRTEAPQSIPSNKEISFKSIAQSIRYQVDKEMAADEANARKHKKPSNKINDPHIKGLTSEKMIDNLKHHGTVFNMSDDGANDLLDADVTDELEVSDSDIPTEMDFEDEI